VLADIVAPRSYTLKFEGQGGAAGFANGMAKVELSPVDGNTRIDYAECAGRWQAGADRCG
jgi:carbon monoxide dehydrogenase subunit G